jgi:methyl-accepting chemotaxis protein
MDNGAGRSHGAGNAAAPAAVEGLMTLSLKTKTRVIYAGLFLCFALLGGLAVNRIAAVNHQSAVMRTVWTPRSRAADDLAEAAREYRISEALRILSLEPEMAEHADGDLADNAQQFEARLAAYRKLLQPKESPAAVANIGQLWSDYRASNEQMLALAAAGEAAEAADRFRNSASRFYLLSTALNDLAETNIRESSAASVRADTIYHQARMIMLLALGLVAIMVATAAVFFETRVWKVLVKLSGVMQRLARGDLAAEVSDAARRDEVGEMARAVQVFKDNGLEMRRLEGDAQAQAAAAAEARRQNDEVLAAVEAQRTFVVSQLAVGLAELSGGNLTFRLSEAFAPEFEKLRDDFNGAMDQLQDAMKLIKTGAMGIRTGVDEISQAAGDLSRRTEQQAASLEETAATLDQITVTIQRTANGSAEASSVVLAAKTDAERSGQIVRDAVGAMSEIEQSAKQIAQIIGVIDEIAFQTNLLALNAGVEAARAGDAGRGFAVVASEVRALAQRSAAAAKEIKALISTSTTQVNNGVQLVGQTGEALERILESVAGINALVAEIAASAKDQATGLHEVNTAIDQMDQVTQQNASMVQESTAASFNLAAESQQFTELISRFEIGEVAVAEIGRRPRQAPSAPAPRRMRQVVGGAPVAEESDVADGDWEEF